MSWLGNIPPSFTKRISWVGSIPPTFRKRVSWFGNNPPRYACTHLAVVGIERL
jgi:hypothetical protein